MPDSGRFARTGLPPVMPAPLPVTPAPPRAAYLHIPFCHLRCFYCDFPVVPLGDRADGAAGPGSASIAAYLQLLLAEIEADPGPAAPSARSPSGTTGKSQ